MPARWPIARSFPRPLLGGHVLEDDSTKWWADDKRIVCVYYITARRDEIFMVTGSPEPDWPHPTSSVPSDMAELCRAFADFHPDLRRVMTACPAITKWAMFERDPLPLWSEGRIVLLGDACHPMTPYMGQGAAMAIEDAAMLTRCLDQSPADIDFAFRLYEANRKGRTASIQRTSGLNTWLRDEASTWVDGQADPDSVYGYDVFNEPLVLPADQPERRGAERRAS